MPLRRTILVAAVVLLGVLTPTDAQSTTVAAGVAMNLMLSTIRTKDSNIIAAGSQSESTLITSSSGTTTTGGPLWPLTRTLGFGGSARNILFTPDSCINMNTLGEVILSYAALKLMSDTQFTTSLDNAIDATLAPGGLSLKGNGKSITYKQLLTHTSTITDALFTSFVVTPPNVVGSLESFVTSYFVTGSGQQNSAVFLTGVDPGTAAAYTHARANTALMAYILQKVITNFNLPASTLKQYIVTNVLIPFGMSSTFWLNSDGTLPGLTPSPSFSGTLSGFDTSSSAVYTQYYAGCIADQLTTRQLHPAWIADYMGYTTLNDINRLARSIFMDSTTSTQMGLMMQETFLTTTSTSASVQQGQVGAGLGLVFFNGDTVCASAIATTAISACPVTNASTVVGFVAARGASLVGFLCTIPSTSSSTNNYLCTSSAFILASSNAAAYDNVFAAAGAAFQDNFGTVTVVTPPTPAPLRTSWQDELFGVSVFFGVYLSILFVIFGTMILQYFLLPPSLPQATNTNAFSVGAGARLSPRRGVATGPLQDGFSPQQ